MTVTARTTYGALAALLLAGALVAATAHGAYWQLAAFGLGPDLPLFAGFGDGLEKGRLHPRAVPLYNLLHRFWLPLVLLLLAAAGVLPLGYLAGGLAWCFHISLDRTVGYGLRTRDGFQRP